MISILAIAVLTIKSVIRSGLFTMIVIFMALLMFALTSNIQPDGALTGTARVFLTYYLGITFAIICITTLWVSAGIATDIDSRRIHMIAVKPVPMYRVWLGKWAGIVAINLILLMILGALIMLSFKTPGFTSKHSAQQIESIKHDILAGHIMLTPRNENDNTEINVMIDDMYKQGLADEHTDRNKVKDLCIRQLMASRSIVSAGAVKSWTIDLPALGSQPASPPRIGCRFQSVARDIIPVKCKWTIDHGNSDTPVYSIITTNNLNEDIHIPLPASAVTGSRTLKVTLENLSSRQLILDSHKPLYLAIKADGFAGNLVRSLLVMLFNTALVAAVGITCGSLLSLPVATFCSSAILVIALLGQSLAFLSSDRWSSPQHTHDHGSHTEKTLFDKACERTAGLLSRAIAPAVSHDSISLVSDGILVTWQFTFHAFLVQICGYSLGFAAIGSYFLRRREFGLPTRQ